MTSNDDAHLSVQDDARAITNALWQRFLADLDRYHGEGTAVTDPGERLRVRLSLATTGLLLAAMPAGKLDDLRCKTLVAAWLRDNDQGDYALAMIETAISADMDRLQPGNDLPACATRQ